jgi:hypothetical protein
MVKKKTTTLLTTEPVVAEAVDAVMEDKQYTIFHTIGADPEFFVSQGTDYKLATIDIQSMHTGEIYAHPVFVIDEKEDTVDIIPFGSVAKVRYNWGWNLENEKFKNDLMELKRSMKHKKPKENTSSKMSSTGKDTPIPREDNQHLYG